MVTHGYDGPVILRSLPLCVLVACWGRGSTSAPITCGVDPNACTPVFDGAPSVSLDSSRGPTADGDALGDADIIEPDAHADGAVSDATDASTVGSASPRFSLTELPLLEGASKCDAQGVNDHGQVAGNCTLPAGDHGVIWDGAVPTREVLDRRLTEMQSETLSQYRARRTDPAR
jgi:hypothetical protein